MLDRLILKEDGENFQYGTALQVDTNNRRVLVSVKNGLQVWPATNRPISQAFWMDTRWCSQLQLDRLLWSVNFPARCQAHMNYWWFSKESLSSDLTFSIKLLACLQDPRMN
jgi:hypothetical protein